MTVKPRFVSRSFVFGHDAFCHGAVDCRYGRCVGSIGVGFVTGLDGFQNVLDGRTGVRTLTGVATAVAF